MISAEKAFHQTAAMRDRAKCSVAFFHGDVFGENTRFSMYMAIRGVIEH